MALYYKLIHFAHGEWQTLGTTTEKPMIGQIFTHNGKSYQATGIGGHEDDYFRDVTLNEVR